MAELGYAEMPKHIDLGISFTAVLRCFAYLLDHLSATLGGRQRIDDPFSPGTLMHDITSKEGQTIHPEPVLRELGISF